ncbi:MAG: hypothetical protein AMR96_00205 [Candidatus Adiutrix intracellularis]|nr:MAG: hypothetical protein AMR96_00205 [Candidatus Adiutrix intracellularis]
MKNFVSAKLFYYQYEFIIHVQNLDRYNFSADLNVLVVIHKHLSTGGTHITDLLNLNFKINFLCSLIFVKYVFFFTILMAMKTNRRLHQ